MVCKDSSVATLPQDDTEAGGYYFILVLDR